MTNAAPPALGRIASFIHRFTVELVASVGVLIGLAAQAQTYFHSGSLPTSVQVAGLLAGAGLSGGSILGYLAHRFGLSKAQLAHDITLAGRGYDALSNALSAIEADFPGVKSRVDALDASIAERFAHVAQIIPAPVDVKALAADAAHVVLTQLAASASAPVVSGGVVAVADALAPPAAPAAVAPVDGNAAPDPGATSSLA
jgi:hypothetical protein